MSYQNSSTSSYIPPNNEGSQYVATTAIQKPLVESGYVPIENNPILIKDSTTQKNQTEFSIKQTTPGSYVDTVYSGGGYTSTYPVTTQEYTKTSTSDFSPNYQYTSYTSKVDVPAKHSRTGSEQRTSPVIKALTETTEVLLKKSGTGDNTNLRSSGLQDPGFSLGNRTSGMGISGNVETKVVTTMYKSPFESSNYQSNYTEYKPPLLGSYDLKSKDFGAGIGSSTITNPFATTSSNTFAGESLKKAGFNSSDYKESTSKPISRDEQKIGVDNYMGLPPTSHNTNSLKSRVRHGSGQYQSTNIGTPFESLRKNDRYARSDVSGLMSPSFKPDTLEAREQNIDEIIINSPNIMKKTTYTIENSGFGVSQSGRNSIGYLGSVNKTPERTTTQKSGSPSPLDDLKKVLKGDNVQISKIIIETIENCEDTDVYKSFDPINSKISDRLDIAVEEIRSYASPKRTALFESPYQTRSLPHRTADQGACRDVSSIVKEKVTRSQLRESRTEIGGTLSAIDQRIKNLDEYLETRGSRVSTEHNNPAPAWQERERVVERTIDNPIQNQDIQGIETIKQRSHVSKKIEDIPEEKPKKMEKEEKKVQEPQKKVEQKSSKTKEKIEKIEKTKEQKEKDSGFVAKTVIAFLVILLTGILIFELNMGTEEFDNLMDS